MSEPKPNEEYLSYERLLDDWWDTHKDDVYLREDPVAVEEDEPVVQSLAPSPQESISMDFDEEESSAIFVEEEVIEEEEPAPPSVTYGEGVSTLKQLSADVKNPDVSKRSLNAYLESAIRAP